MRNPDFDPKRQVRSEVRTRLAVARPGAGEAVCAAVRRWLAGHPGLRTVAAYAAMADEVDLLPLLAALPERRWLMPRVVGDDLVFHRVIDPALDLTAGAFGIREPRADLPQVPVAEIDALLCPGLAFDSNGGRLGRGRGFYDRVLAQARPDALRVGVCHPLQRVPDTYPAGHDVPMHLVIDGSDAGD